MKLCRRCGTEKTLDAFSRKGEGYQDACKDCATEYKRYWIAKNRDKVRWNTIWTKYRLRKEDWERMMDEQGGLCALCREREATHIDHDHSCCPGGKSCGVCVRKILCGKCNTVVGMIETSEHFLDRVLEYVAVDYRKVP